MPQKQKRFWSFLRGCPFPDECAKWKCNAGEKRLHWSGPTPWHARDGLVKHLTNSWLHCKSEKEAWRVANAIKTSVEPYYEEVPTDDEVDESDEYYEEAPAEERLAKRSRLGEALARPADPSSASGQQPPVTALGDLLAEAAVSINQAKEAAHQAVEISEKAARAFKGVADTLGLAAERLQAIRVEQAAQLPSQM